MIIEDTVKKISIEKYNLLAYIFKIALQPTKLA